MHPALANPFDQNSVSPVGENTSDGGTGVQPFVHAAAAWEVPAPRKISGKQEGQTGSEVGTLQTPGSPMLSARTLPIPARQAPGPSETKFILDEQAFMDAIEPPPLFLQPGYKFARRVS